MSILNELSDYAVYRVNKAQENISLEQIKEQAFKFSKGDFQFEKSLSKAGLSFILECKKASPSKGVIAHNFDYLNIAKDYEKAGADAISVLTEPKWFMGNNSILKEISANVKIQCLRKDFTVHEYMIYEAKILGAGAVLLITSILTEKQISQYIKICDTLGISALVEVHDEEEIKKALSAGARIIGVNNRNLKDFTIDINNSQRLRQLVPDNIIYVCESGVKDHDDIKRLCEIGADAVLIGETMMKASNKKEMLERLKGEI